MAALIEAPCFDHWMGEAETHRERLLDATAAVVARHGYGNASVARVIAEAGVSRATFYKRFDNLDECVLAAFDRIAQAVEAGAARLDSGTPAELLAELLTAAARDPAAARLFLIEALAGPAPVRARHRSVHSQLAEKLDGGLLAPGSATRIELTGDCLIGGISSVVALRVFRGEPAQLPDLCDDLLTWVDSYAVDGDTSSPPLDWPALGDGLRPEPDLPPPLGAALEEGPLPRGRGALPGAVVAERQRIRLLAAMARLSRRQGYRATGVDDLVATAGVTRDSFYKLFRSKQDLFLAAQSYGLEQSVALTVRHFFGPGSWPDRGWSALRAMLSYIASQPDLVYVDLVEGPAAGPPAIRRSYETRMAFTLFVEEGFRQGAAAEAMPRICAEAIAGAIYALFRRETEAGRSERMLTILPQAAYLVLAPFLGAEAATELIEAKIPGERSG